MSRHHYAWKPGTPPPTLGDHSVAKHEIFEQYVQIYIDRLTRTPGQTMLNMTIVDGFCGGGLYRQDAGTADGSPLLLLRAVDRAGSVLSAARHKGFDLRADFFFVDNHRNHIAFLREELIKRGYAERIDRDIHLVHSEFEAACPQIIHRIRSKGTAHRSLFFLDQYGWSDVRLGTLRNILNSLQNPEILLTFAVDALVNHLSEDTQMTKALMAIELEREDVRALMAMRNGEGWRYLIQNGLYGHIQARTGAKFYTPFFIRSAESYRSYWLLHLSGHRQARDEMGKLHWRLNNHFQHHGGAGFQALGFDPSQDLRQGLLDFMFDDGAMRLSEKAVLEQLPRMIHNAQSKGGGLVVHELFAGNCNDTPVTSDILTRQLVLLREEGELAIITAKGARKPRAKTIAWDDRLVLPKERLLFSRFGT